MFHNSAWSVFFYFLRRFASHLQVIFLLQYYFWVIRDECVKDNLYFSKKISARIGWQDYHEIVKNKKLVDLENFPKFNALADFLLRALCSILPKFVYFFKSFDPAKIPQISGNNSAGNNKKHDWEPTANKNMWWRAPRKIPAPEKEKLI